MGVSEKEGNILLRFPIVYIHNWKNHDQYEIYIGESIHFIKRTKQHYTKGRDEDNWRHQILSHKDKRRNEEAAQDGECVPVLSGDY
ncbi:MAG: hypothetical protein J6K58_03260 [Lachnospiraceae bacterium]|nr:hypothetical protein [Lachnospiraceae bacterium]